MRLERAAGYEDRRDRAILACLLLSALLSSLGSSIANVALPTLADSFNTSVQAAQWVVIAYLLGATLLTVVAGRIADLVGSHLILRVGVGLFAATSLIASAAPSLLALIAIRLVQGAAAAAMLTAPLAMVSGLTSKAGRSIGLIGAMSAAGTAIGPSLGGILLDTLGWRSLFAACAGLAGVVLLLLFRTSIVTRPEGTVRSVKSGSFVWAPIRHASIILNLASTACVAAVLTASLVVGPFYLKLALGLRPAAIGLAMVVGPGVVVAGSIAAGRLADAIGAGRTAFFGSVVMLGGCAMICSIGVSFAVAGYLFSIAVLTLGYALFQTGNNKLVMDQAGEANKGVFSGLLNLSRSAGGTAGAALLGSVFAAVSGSQTLSDITAQSAASGLQRTFAAAAVLIAVSFASALTNRSSTVSQPAQVSAVS